MFIEKMNNWLNMFYSVGYRQKSQIYLSEKGWEIFLSQGWLNIDKESRK